MELDCGLWIANQKDQKQKWVVQNFLCAQIMQSETMTESTQNKACLNQSFMAISS